MHFFFRPGNPKILKRIPGVSAISGSSLRCFQIIQSRKESPRKFYVVFPLSSQRNHSPFLIPPWNLHLLSPSSFLLLDISYLNFISPFYFSRITHLEVREANKTFTVDLVNSSSFLLLIRLWKKLH